MLVFDLTNRNSFSNLSKWLKDFKDSGPEDATIIIVANKIDLEAERQVTHEELEEFAKKKKLDFYEVSAKNGFNVSLLFESVATQLVKKEKLKQGNDNNINNKSNTSKKRGSKLYTQVHLTKKQIQEMEDKEMEKKAGCC